MALISTRANSMESSGIRKVFDLAASLKNPIDLSIGQPDFDVPDVAKEAMIEAVKSGRNAYTPSPGIAPLREAVAARCASVSGFEPEAVMITSGTSGGIALSMLALIDPGDEVLVPDPFFVGYKQLVLLAGGKPVYYNTYPDFRVRAEEIERHVTDRTKVLLLNSPANPTGVTITEGEIAAACEVAKRHSLTVLSDEIYDPYWYDFKPASAARFYDRVVTLNGWSKSHAMTGWRAGWAAGPKEIIDTMIKLQQFTYVCPPTPAQHAALATISLDMEKVRADYKRKRDLACDILSEGFELVRPDGAFYAFPKAPSGTGTELVTRAIEASILVIPGGVFSNRDTHFRVSFAAADSTIEKGCRKLVELAAGR